MSHLVLTAVTGEQPAAIGGLFNGLAFFLTQRLPSRAQLVNDIQANGGRVVKLEKIADYVISDHARKDAPSGSFSWKFIEEALREGQIPNPAKHAIGSRTVSSSAPPKATRTPFTAEDDQALWEFVKRAEAKGGSVKGNDIYMQLAFINPRHTYQSWRDRYIKRLIDRPPAAADDSPVERSNPVSGALLKEEKVSAASVLADEPTDVLPPAKRRKLERLEREIIEPGGVAVSLTGSKHLAPKINMRPDVRFRGGNVGSLLPHQQDPRAQLERRPEISGQELDHLGVSEQDNLSAENTVSDFFPNGEIVGRTADRMSTLVTSQPSESVVGDKIKPELGAARVEARQRLKQLMHIISAPGSASGTSSEVPTSEANELADIQLQREAQQQPIERRITKVGVSIGPAARSLSVGSEQSSASVDISEESPSLTPRRLINVQATDGTRLREHDLSEDESAQNQSHNIAHPGDVGRPPNSKAGSLIQTDKNPRQSEHERVEGMPQMLAEYKHSAPGVLNSGRQTPPNHGEDSSSEEFIEHASGGMIRRNYTKVPKVGPLWSPSGLDRVASITTTQAQLQNFRKEAQPNHESYSPNLRHEPEAPRSETHHDQLKSQSAFGKLPNASSKRPWTWAMRHLGLSEIAVYTRHSNTFFDTNLSSGSSSDSEIEESHVDNDPLDESRTQVLETQDIYNAQTQYPNFTIALPPVSDEEIEEDEAYEPEQEESFQPGTYTIQLPTMISIPSPLESEAAKENAPDDVSNDQPDETFPEWQARMQRLGFTDLLIITEALKCTSMTPDLAEYVLRHWRIVGGEPKAIPDHIPGIWTARDDEWLEGGDARKLRAVEKKHGEKECTARREWLEQFRDQE